MTLASLGLTPGGYGRSQFEQRYVHQCSCPTVDNGKVTRKAQAGNRQHSQIQVVVVQVPLEPRNYRARVVDHVLLYPMVKEWVAPVFLHRCEFVRDVSTDQVDASTRSCHPMQLCVWPSQGT